MRIGRPIAMLTIAVGALVIVVASGCGASDEPAASPATTTEPSPQAGAVEKTPPAWLAEFIRDTAAMSGDPKPTWAEWTITTLGEAATAFAPAGDVANQPEWAADPDRKVWAYVLHGSFENTRAGSTPAGDEGTPSPTLFPWYASVGDVSSQTGMSSVWLDQRPDTSGLSEVYVYAW